MAFALGLGVLCPITFLSISTLTSCSVVKPTLSTTSNITTFWRNGNTFTANSIWDGYYQSDILEPKVTIPAEHKNDIESKPFLRKDERNKFLFVDIEFTFKTSPTNESKPFDIKVEWLLDHTNLKKETLIHVEKPKPSYIGYKGDVNITTKPKKQDYHLLKKEYSCIESINELYNYDPSGQPEESIENFIETNLNNDFIYYASLAHKQLECLFIDDTFNIKLNPSTFKMHYDYLYNYATHVFDYIKIDFEMSSKLYLNILPIQSLDINVSYSWGGHEEGETGPQLLGAFTPNYWDDRKTHFPTGYDGKIHTYIPYTQTFLQLVPSSLKSYQYYDFSIKPPKGGLPININLGKHLYNATQPRFFGLEFANGQGHFSTYNPAKAAETDSLAAMQLYLPSMKLSNVVFDENVNAFTEPNHAIKIHKNFSNIGKLLPNFKDVYGNSSQTRIQKRKEFATNFLKPMDNNYIEGVYTGNFNEFIKNCKNKFDLFDKAVNISQYDISIFKDEFSDQQEEFFGFLPYYKIFSSPSVGLWAQPDLKWGNNYGMYPIVQKPDPVYPKNPFIKIRDHELIEYDDKNDEFTLFTVPLNNLFNTDNMEPSIDGAFSYSAELLRGINNFNF